MNTNINRNGFEMLQMSTGVGGLKSLSTRVSEPRPDLARMRAKLEVL